MTKRFEILCMLLIAVITFKIFGCSSTRNVDTQEKNDLRFYCQEPPVEKIYQLGYGLEVFELINDSTLSEKPIFTTVIYQTNDTLELTKCLSNRTNWKKTESLEVCYPLNLPGIYFFKSIINSNGLFGELTLIRGVDPKCTESIRKSIQTTLDDIVVMDKQHFNKTVCFRINVRINE
jgi:hypothetical protein